MTPKQIELMLKIAAGVLVAAVIATVIWVVFIRPGQLAQKAAEAEIQGKVAGAAASAGQVAVGAVSANEQEKAGIEARVRGGQDALEQVDPDQYDSVTRRELCKSAAYSDTDACM